MPPPVAPAPVPAPAGFALARRPITSPTLVDSALPTSSIRPLFLYQNLPDRVSSTLGKLPVGGDFQVYAVQLEYAFTERFSFTAVKDGYIDFNPDSTLSEEDGWANLAAGFKWAFLYDPVSETAASLQLIIEAPTGNDDVWQGEGDGVAIPSVSFLKLWDRLQLGSTLGFRLPFDTDAESTSLFYGGHLSYAVTDRFFPLVEFNWYHVLDEGDGGNRFDSQVGGLVPGVVEFEGGDLVNFGASNASENRDFLSLGVGFRYRALDSLDVGFAFEFPLLDDEDGIMENRFIVDAVWRF